MNKVVKKGIKKAIIIYEDPDTGEGRRVVFGETTSLMSFLVGQLPSLWERLQQMSGKKFNNPLEMIMYYEKHKGKGIKTHGIEGADDMSMSLIYQVKRLK